MGLKRLVPRKVKGAYRRARRSLKATIPAAAPAASVPARYAIDSPLSGTIDQQTVTVQGWIIPHKGYTVRGVQVTHNGQVHDVPFGLSRVDVAKAFPDNVAAATSGFSLELQVVDGSLSIAADFGKGYKQIHDITLTYSPELLVKDYFNPDLAQRQAEHLNLQANKKQYYFELDQTASYARHEADPRLVAFYLPQFHPIKQNDAVWGKGFTEWTNVTGDMPRFVGHQQPILPRDLGFYDLRNESIIKQQVDMAKQHGIYGFCFYYYWFSGERILEQPIDSFVNHKDWDFNFSICWANENWTKRWDGRDSEVIIAQKYAKDDPLKFIQDVEHILLDPRYITEDGKPVLTVFRASELKDTAEYARVWREYFRTKHNRELQLVSIISFEDKDPREYGFDKALDFAPQSSFFKNDAFPSGRYPWVDVSDKLLDTHFTGTVADYRTVALNKANNDYFKFPTYKCVTPSWDNDARKKGKGFVFTHESPDVYAQWLDNVLSLEAQQTAPLVFINAWNEWAEGAILEPSQHYGSAILNRTTEVLAAHSQNKQNQANFPRGGITKRRQAELAVVLHLYYPESWPQIKERLGLIDDSVYDLFISLPKKHADFVSTITDFKPSANIQVVPNRGRDVLPFILLLPKLQAAGYESVLKLHSKKTLHRENGAEWLPELLENLLPSRELIAKTIQELAQPGTLIGPDKHFISLRRYMGSDEPHLKELLTRLYDGKIANKILTRADRYGYFAGSMFWVNLTTLQPLINSYLLPEDFESEQGQIDGTLAHAVERLMSIIPTVSSGRLLASNTTGLREVKEEDALSTYPYAA